MSLVAVLLAWGGSAVALGLGEIRTGSALGDFLVAEVDVLTSGREAVDAACFRLNSPQGETDLPWLRRASLVLKKGPPTRLEIRSAAPVRDPVLQIGIVLGCGHEVQRDYTVLLEPRDIGDSYRFAPPAALPPQTDMPPLARRRPARAAAVEALPPVPRRPPRRQPTAPQPDRLVLTAPGEGGGEPALRMSTDLFAWRGEGGGERERERELLRVEYQLLAAMSQQATSQLEAAEKLRSMETALGQLQQHAADFSGRLEKEAAAQVPAGQPAAPVVPLPQPAAPAQEGLSEWGFYGALLALALSVAGWIGWRQYSERRAGLLPEEPFVDELPEPEAVAAAQPLSSVDLPVEPAAEGGGMAIDVPLGDEVQAESGNGIAVYGLGFQQSHPGTTVDEHFEANPVMELAEIMLSFGRVKGAAQALQEFVDHNPQEALKPWIRLMEIYRMAGMRDEFERVSRELNRNFNVEIQQWSPEETPVALDRAIDLVLEAEAVSPPRQSGPKAMSLEDMAHIRNRLIETWAEPQAALNYLNLLLRDNRGGKRLGFPLPVVEEILLLVDMVETKISMEKAAA